MLLSLSLYSFLTLSFPIKPVSQLQGFTILPSFFLSLYALSLRPPSCRKRKKTSNKTPPNLQQFSCQQNLSLFSCNTSRLMCGREVRLGEKGKMDRETGNSQNKPSVSMNSSGVFLFHLHLLPVRLSLRTLVVCIADSLHSTSMTYSQSICGQFL